jgi:PII-like signaling protein
MADFKAGQLLRIFIGEGDAWHGAPLHLALVRMLKDAHVAGASVFRGIEGFGSHHEIHVMKTFGRSHKLPILIEVVEDEDKIAALIPRIEEMVSEGTVTLESVQYRRPLPLATRKRR